MRAPAPEGDDARTSPRAGDGKGEAARGWSIGRLARRFRLARSTLLYYDRLGLLRPSRRTPHGYRIYDDAGEARLAAVCRYRAAGVPLRDIRRILDATGETARLLAARFAALDEELGKVREQQRIVAELLRESSRGPDGAGGAEVPARLDKARWIAILRATGLDDAAMHRWHVAFERAAPDGHQEFLESLRLSKAEIDQIRRRSRSA